MSGSKNSYASKSSGVVCTPTPSNSPTSDRSANAVIDRAHKRGEVMKTKTVSICCFTAGMQLYAVDAALVAVDVIRASTTAITAVSMGRKCHMAPTLQAALETAARLPKALLAGELGGYMPDGFDLTNSPA